MNRDIFGTDGIRGPAGTYPLDEDGATRVGKAVAQYFASPGEFILIGRDTRQSSPMLDDAVSLGINSMGVEVKQVGVVPTAGLAYLTQQLHAPAGVMITASHNPYTDNGIKVFSSSGTKLPDNTESELNKLIQEGIPDRGFGQVENARNLVKTYEDFLISSVGDILLDKFHIAIDCANGATSFVSRGIFEALHMTVDVINNNPDGKNINDHCGATNTNSLQEYVVQAGCDAGIAFDGDGDRVIFVDRKGRTLNGDYLLYILSQCRQDKGVVMTSMSNIGLEIALNSKGVKVLRTAVGDRYVLEGIEQSGYTIGGEQSGHIILPDIYNTGDGILTALQMFMFLKQSNKDLSEWYEELEIWPQVLINIPLDNKIKLEQAAVKVYIAEKVQEAKQYGRLNIRPSGTEQLLRIMVEAPDAEKRAKQIADELTNLLTK